MDSYIKFAEQVLTSYEADSARSIKSRSKDKITRNLVEE